MAGEAHRGAWGRGLAVCAIVLATAGTGAPVSHAWQASTGGTVARACLVGPIDRPVAGRVAVVARGGHDCGVEGPVTRAAGGRGWLLRPAEGPGCTIRLDRVGRSLRFTDVDGACAQNWCGAGVALGTRLVAPDSRAGRLRCGDS